MKLTTPFIKRTSSQRTTDDSVLLRRLKRGLRILRESKRWRLGDGSTRVRWASRDSLVGLRYLVRWYGDTGIVMAESKALLRKILRILQGSTPIRETIFLGIFPVARGLCGRRHSNDQRFRPKTLLSHCMNSISAQEARAQPQPRLKPQKNVRGSFSNPYPLYF